MGSPADEGDVDNKENMESGGKGTESYFLSCLSELEDEFAIKK